MYTWLLVWLSRGGSFLEEDVIRIKDFIKSDKTVWHTKKEFCDRLVEIFPSIAKSSGTFSGYLNRSSDPCIRNFYASINQDKDKA